MNCAACGKTGESLKLCTACKAVRYCDVTCQKNHRKDHRKECKRMALALKAQEEATPRFKVPSISLPENLDDLDSDLWKSPPRPDCPICMQPLPLRPQESGYMVCCGKTVCAACDLRSQEAIAEKRFFGSANASLKETCAFCREALPDTEESLERLKKRMELNDPEAFLHMAQACADGDGVPKDEQKGFEYLLRSVELGDANAYFRLARHYREGKIVDADKKKCKEYLQLAAMGGDVEARHDLGMLEYENHREDLAIRHWRIAAGSGLEPSMKNIKYSYVCGVSCGVCLVTKDEFAETLRAYQAAQEDLRSEARDRYRAFRA